MCGLRVTRCRPMFRCCSGKTRTVCTAAVPCAGIESAGDWIACWGRDDESVNGERRERWYKSLSATRDPQSLLLPPLLRPSVSHPTSSIPGFFIISGCTCESARDVCVERGHDEPAVRSPDLRTAVTHDVIVIFDSRALHQTPRITHGSQTLDHRATSPFPHHFLVSRVSGNLDVSPSFHYFFYSRNFVS